VKLQQLNSNIYTLTAQSYTAPSPQCYTCGMNKKYTINFEPLPEGGLRVQVKFVAYCGKIPRDMFQTEGGTIWNSITFGEARWLHEHAPLFEDHHSW
jgi:hypothetical protein